MNPEEYERKFRRPEKEVEGKETGPFTKAVLKKLKVYDPAELDDKVRKTTEKFTRDDEINTLIDLYLFGKGIDINS